MEFDIDIKTGLNGHILLEDYSLEYDRYIPDNLLHENYRHYRYNECQTINVLTKITTQTSNIIGTYLHKHDQLEADPTNPNEFLYDVEKTTIHLKNDGFYHIHHIVLPTIKWYEEIYLPSSDEYKTNFDVVYIIDDGTIYKFIEGNFKECPIQEIIERNPQNTTIEKCVIDVFYTGFLQLCYIDYCNKLFETLTKKCDYSCSSSDNSELIYARDFLWMVLNTIDYLISFKQYMEAQRILEITNGCGGFCKNYGDYAKSGCGCS